MFYQTHQNRNWQNSPEQAPRVCTVDTETPGGGYREFCRKCNGRGKFIGYTGRVFGDCFACKGVGYRDYKSAPEQRAQARASSSARKARSEAESFEAFAAAYPELWAW